MWPHRASTRRGRRPACAFSRPPQSGHAGAQASAARWTSRSTASLRDARLAASTAFSMRPMSASAGSSAAARS